MKRNDPYSDQIYSYLVLRNALGWIGILLPVVLVFGNSIIFRCNCIQSSISRYYYTGMRDVLVGALCSIALFLLYYKGYSDWKGKWKRNWDQLTSTLAGFCAIIVALFPMNETGQIRGSGIVHLISAIIFFLTLAFISYFLFTIRKEEPVHNPRKTVRNFIYRACGVVIVLCLFAMGIFFLLASRFFTASTFLFWAETIALIAFGVSWITKGGTLLPDKIETKETDEVSGSKRHGE